MGPFLPAPITNPLAKSIRTLEGILAAAAGVTVWVISLVDPHTLSKPEAAKWSAVSAVALLVSRTIIKGLAILNPGGAAVPPLDVAALAANLAAHIGVALPSTTELRALVTDAVHAANSPAGLLAGAEAVLLPTDVQEAAQPPPAPAATP